MIRELPMKHLASRIAQRSLFVLGVALISARAVEAGLNFDQGLQNYNQKKLDAAAQCFAADIKNGSANSKNFYYLANCLYGMRRLDGFPKRIDVNYNKDVANANLRAMPKLKDIDLSSGANDSGYSDALDRSG